MNATLQFSALSAIAAMLVGCGGSDAGDTKATDASGSTASAASDWDATDACALLDKAAVGAALKDEVTETSLAFVTQASGPNAATSECTYRLASGGTATLMTRSSPIEDNTPEAIATTRKATEQSMAAFSDKKIEDVPGLGIAAFFVPGINQLNVFLDSKRFAILTVSSAPGDTAKATAIDLAGKIAD